jgi:PiT family inorganic phosphate transporter
MATIVALLAAVLAIVNGGNDVAKGVATLAGSGVTGYRVAVGYGALTTLVGSSVRSGWVRR